MSHPVLLTMTRDEMLDRARALLPAIADRRAPADAQYDISKETVAEIKAAGLYRGFQPAKWGGLECDPRSVLDVQTVFAEVCLSTAWIFGVLSLQSFFLARFDERAQADVWGEDPHSLLSSSFFPAGQVSPVDGGYRISGRFGYSSGSSHCDWALVGGMVAAEMAGEPPHLRLFLVPRADYRIDNVWRTIGLKATGSNDLVIADAFVPEYRTYRPDPGLLPLTATSGVPSYYRLPWLQLASIMISNVAIGGARGAMQLFVEATKPRRGAPLPPGVPQNPALMSVIARVQAESDTAELVTRRNFGRFLEAIAHDEAMELTEALTYRVQLTGSLRKLLALVDEMQMLMGARGIQEDSLFARFWLDLIAARAHVGNDPAGPMAMLAGAMDL